MSLPKGIRVSVNNTPQAQDDFWELNEDGSTTQYLDVLANDLGGESKVLWSVYQDEELTPENEQLTQSAVGEWVELESGAKVRITSDGRIEYDYTAINTSLIQSLGEGDEFTDTFSYSIRLGNGTISTATVNLTYVGENDAATILGTNTGSVTEDGASGLSFAEAVSYEAGSYPSPHGLSVGDVNGDGKADIVTADHLDHTVSVLLNDGSGAFLPRAAFATGAAPDDATVADVNGDGKADIVTANGPSNQISVLLGNGDGTFGSATLFASGIGTYTNAVALADLNGDGKLDAVCAGNNAVSLLLGNGDGTFQSATVLNHGVARPASVALADMDNDGDIDIVTAGIDSDDFSILYNTGGGTFGSPSTFATGGDAPTNVAVGDLNGDTYADIVAANTQSNDVSVLLSDGNGGFATADQYTLGADTPIGVALADFDGDGDRDVVTSNVNGNLSVLLNDGSGEFGSPETFSTGTGSVTPSVAAVELNGDGKVDIVTSDVANDSAWALLNDGGVTPGTPFASGDLDIVDPDAGEAKFQAVATADLEGTYGDFTFDHETGEWTYTLDNSDPETQNLNAGDVVSDSLLVTSLDGTASETITVSITGADDWLL
jgi:VCBS repeat-containing protein